MTTEQRISDWMKDREDELVEALRPLRVSKKSS